MNTEASIVPALAAALTLATAAHTHAEVRSLTLGINSTCVSGLGE